jgi:paraquat-inducible protein A
LISHPLSLAARAQGFDRLIGPGLLAAAVLLILGWNLPIMTITRLVVFDEKTSILEGAMILLRQGEVFLFIVLVLFSVVFPLIKLICALIFWFRIPARTPWLPRWTDRIDLLGKWSMLDVFVVALGVVAVQISLVSEILLHAGLYLFLAAILLSMICVGRILGLARRAARAAER